MQNDRNVSPILVRFSDGGTFETSASSASEYLMDSCFVRFLFLCIVLYGILMYREDLAQLEPDSQVMLWIAMFVATACWLIFSVGLSLFLVRRGFVSFVFTPAIIFPMVPINIFTASILSEYLGAEYWLTFPDNIGAIAQNLVAAICFDILHGRYVAPTHPTYVRRERENEVMPGHAQTVAMNQTDPEQTLPEIDPIESEPPEYFIEISGKRLDHRDIVYLQSEDHYLKIQLTDKILLLRGKLKETVKLLDHRLGLQINRSVWVAFSGIKGVDENRSGYLEITLNDDTSFKVTNSRKMSFLQNYKLYSGGGSTG